MNPHYGTDNQSSLKIKIAPSALLTPGRDSLILVVSLRLSLNPVEIAFHPVLVPPEGANPARVCPVRTARHRETFTPGTFAGSAGTGVMVALLIPFRAASPPINLAPSARAGWPVWL